MGYHGGGYAAPSPQVERGTTLIEPKVLGLDDTRDIIFSGAKAAGLDIVHDDTIDGVWSHQSRDYMGDLDDARELSRDIDGVEVPATETVETGMAPRSMMGRVVKRIDDSYGRHKHHLDDKDSAKLFVRWFEEQTGDEQQRWVVQDFVEKPDHIDSPVSIRVLVDTSGNIIASQLFHGATLTRTGKPMPAGGNTKNRKDPANALTNRKSPFCLSSANIASNIMYSAWTRSTTRGKDGPRSKTEEILHGGRAVLDPTKASHPYSDEETYLLRALGLMDRDKRSRSKKFPEGVGRLPDNVASAAERFGRILPLKLTDDGKVLIRSLYLGVDFIPDGEGNWCFLEANRNPSLVTYRDLHGSYDSMSEAAAFAEIAGMTLDRITDDDVLSARAALVVPKPRK